MIARVWRSPTFTRLRCLGAWLGISWAFLAAAGFAGVLGWMSEGAANFAWVPILTVVLAVVALPGIPRAAGGVALIGILAVTFWPPTHLESTDSGPTQLTVMTWNCYYGGLDPARAAAIIEKSNPDVIVFNEITKGLQQSLDSRLRDRYPHYLGAPRPGPSGLVIYSKFPVQNWRRERDPEVWAVCDLTLPDGRTCRTYLVHPPVPNHKGYARRAQYFESVARDIRNWPGPVLVIGDFNATWASLDLRRFCATTNTRVASRFLPSWPVKVPSPFQIAIDHILASVPDFEAIGAETDGSYLGSDHRPVVATFRIKPNPNPPASASR